MTLEPVKKKPIRFSSKEENTLSVLVKKCTPHQPSVRKLT